MSRQRRAQVATLAVLGAALGVIAWRQGAFSGFRLGEIVPAATPKADPTPQDAIYAMLDAARAGDIKGYLAAHTGQMAAALAQALAEQGEAGLAKYLRETNAPVKGVAIQEPQTLTDREVKVRVEYVFADRNEVQFMYLEKTGGRWRIARVDNAERIRTLVPYGTPVQ